MAAHAGRTSARAFGRTSPIRQSEDHEGTQDIETNDVSRRPSSRSARRAAARAQSADVRHSSRGWVVPLFAGIAAIAALTWVDTGVLRSNGGGFLVEKSGSSAPAGSDETASLGRSALFGDSSADLEFADPLNSGGTGPTMVAVGPGSVRVGCWPGNCPDPSALAREFAVSSSFALAKHEVTVADYLRFADATGRSPHLPNGWGEEGLPVVNVSWEDATAYAKWLSAETNRTYRLPAEAEWAYAGLAGEVESVDRGMSTPFGSDPVQPAAVGLREANAFGLHDMDGNVSEWVSDCGVTLPSSGCPSRIRRGGSWINPLPNPGAAMRQISVAGYRSLDTGFRVASAFE